MFLWRSRIQNLNEYPTNGQNAGLSTKARRITLYIYTAALLYIVNDRTAFGSTI